MTDRLSPLDMARNAAASVHRYAEASDRDPLGAHVHHLGEQGHQTAQLAAAMALVSIAEDIHRMAHDLHVLTVAGQVSGRG